MQEAEYLQLLDDIEDVDLYIAELRKANGGKKGTADTYEIARCEAQASHMRGLKHFWEIKAVAAATGAVLPEYGGSQVTAPIGEAIRRKAQERGFVLRQERVA